MVFSSLTFIYYFLPIVIGGYFLIHLILRNKKCCILVKNIFLLVASLVFYAWGGVIYLAIIASIIVINFVFSLLFNYYENRQKIRKMLLILVLILNFGVLFYFKYFNFIAGAIISITKAQITLKEVVLPIGISFFTFQAISYTVDVYKGKSKCQKNILYLALYIAFFPQLIAGPIVQYNSIEEQLDTRKESLESFVQGAVRFGFGLAKKVIIANTLGLVVDKIFGNPDLLNTGAAWIGIVFYTFQILYDFSGYSDMAIGLGKMFGFEFMENFDNPYMSLSIAEFWRRWHISLGAWFREYIYIPMGGNRKGLAITCLNLFIVFLLTGIWHGANWTFIIWGVVFGVFIVLERLFFGKILAKNPIKFINWLYTFFVVMMLWVLFRAPDLGSAMNYYSYLFSPRVSSINPTFYATTQSFIALGLAVVFMGPIQYLWKHLTTKKNIKLNQNVILYIKCGVALVLAVVCIYLLTVNTYNPFIYFNF